MGTFGNACISGSPWFVNSWTHLFLDSAAPENGVLISVCVFIVDFPSVGKVKIFRINGANYDFVGETPSQLMSVGSNTISGLNIPFIAGDILGLVNASRVARVDAPEGIIYAHAGDVTTSTPTSDWEFIGNMFFSVLAEYILPPPVSTVVLGRSPSHSTGASVSGGISVGKGKRRR